MQAQMVALEFCHYDYKNTGYMTYKDFALSLVASGNVAEIRRYLARVATLPDAAYPGKGVTLKEVSPTPTRPALASIAELTPPFIQRIS